MASERGGRWVRFSWAGDCSTNQQQFHCEAVHLFSRFVDESQVDSDPVTKVSQDGVEKGAHAQAESTGKHDSVFTDDSTQTRRPGLEGHYSDFEIARRPMLLVDPLLYNVELKGYKVTAQIMSSFKGLPLLTPPAHSEPSS